METLTLPAQTGLSRAKKTAIIYASVMLSIHLGVLLVISTGVSPVAFLVGFIFYLVRGFGISIGYHRYFAHKSFKTGRFFQFILALMGSLSNQGGVLWWSSTHRGHHKYSDTKDDLHSPIAHNFWHAHLGWMWSKEAYGKSKNPCHDLGKFPELKALNKHYVFVILFQVAGFFGLGVLLNTLYPELGTSGLQILVWGFFISTVFMWHCTFMVNSVCHIWGYQRYKNSGDFSRNNPFVSLVTFGEGWHNNHHKYSWAARNGFKWWEFDPSYYLLKTLALFGIVSDLKVPTQEQLQTTH